MPLNIELKKYLEEMKLEISDEKISDIDIYIREINAWNAKADLTALKGYERMFMNLFLDSATILPFIKNKAALVDIGTGAGFPGLALKIFYDDLNVTLIDSSSKKCVFLSHISNLLKMKDVNVVWGRAEEIGRDSTYREKFDYVCCRAVASMSTISELCIPFLKLGGEFIASKGRDTAEITQAEGVIKNIGGKIEKIENIKYSFFNEEKNLVIVSKIKETPEKYPRRNGIPQKRPLNS
ncbi:MAG: 16S rRNA (guanine(527)-N(7))-methyltransferase RsmG [Candidatus Firestonebacteria bacterium]